MIGKVSVESALLSFPESSRELIMELVFLYPFFLFYHFDYFHPSYYYLPPQKVASLFYSLCSSTGERKMCPH